MRKMHTKKKSNHILDMDQKSTAGNPPTKRHRYEEKNEEGKKPIDKQVEISNSLKMDQQKVEK